LLVLAIAGVLEPDEALSGFANPALATIGGLFLVASGIRATGVIDRMADAMFGETISLRHVLLRLTALAAGGSAFMSNTAIVAIGIPTLTRWARGRGISPSKLLIPLSYASIIGGLLTLIGTSTNIVVDGLMREASLPGLGFFELTIVGLPLTLVVILYLAFVSPHLLPAREPAEGPVADAREYVADLILEASSSLVGVTVERAGLLVFEDLYVVHIERDGHVVAPVEPTERLAAGDRISFAGALEHIVTLLHLEGLRAVSSAGLPQEDETWKPYQVVITPGSPLVGTTLQAGEFRARYNAVVLAVQQRGTEPRTSIGRAILRPGDTLLVEAGLGFGRAHRESSDFLVVQPIEGTVPRRSGRGATAVTILVAMVFAAASGLVALPIAAPTAGLLMILTGCVDPGEARRSVDWSVLVAIGSAIGLAAALQASGGAAILGQGVTALGDHAGKWGLLLGVFVGTVLLTELIINQAAAALVFPIVVAVAGTAGLDPRPLILTATVAASLSFSTPLNYQTNLMVYGPGRYHFFDFTRTGLPLQLLLGVVAVTVIRFVW
ncbi:MAG TPA: SLC13 family permease, partial [Longimicrobiales bacterium]|nr:SLC13 family permease [Longimicrobiales bacterium]